MLYTKSGYMAVVFTFDPSLIESLAKKVSVHVCYSTGEVPT